jgi:glycosyltransferase involved in cell wall biosynthesis
MVTVIIPTYNRGSIVTDAIDSVISQTYRPIELIIVDDGSDDETERIATEYENKVRCEKYIYIKYIYKENGGAPSARNKGFEESIGDYIMFLDSDDILHPQAIEACVKAMRVRPFCNASWGKTSTVEFGPVQFTKFDIQEIIESKSEYDKIDDNLARFADTGEGTGGGILYRRSLCEAAGPWNEALRRGQDLEFNYRVACQNPSFVELSITLYYQRMHDSDQISSLRERPEGITMGFETLESVEQIIYNNDIRDEHVYLTMNEFYLDLANQSLEFGQKSEFGSAISSAIKFSQNDILNMALQSVLYLNTNVSHTFAKSIYLIYLYMWRKTKNIKHKMLTYITK